MELFASRPVVCFSTSKVVALIYYWQPRIFMDVNVVDGQSYGQDKLLAETVVLTRLDQAVGWARKYSLFPYPFATACCAMEYMSLSMSPYDIDRFGALLPRFSPRQAGLLARKSTRPDARHTDI